MKHAVKLAQHHNTEIKCTDDPMQAAFRADVIVTDTWVSMGQEEEKQKRLNDFAGYQVNRKVGSAD